MSAWAPGTVSPLDGAPSLDAPHKPTVLVILGLMASGDAVNPRVNDSSPNEGGSERQSLPSAIEDVAFPVSIRGYDREAVDGYVNRVRDVVTQLETSRSREAAVKQALEKVGEQTKSILEHAGETAEEITVAARQEAKETNSRAKGEASEILARSNAEAEATVAQARQEAAEHLRRSREEVAALREEAEARLRELHADTESIRQDRSQLLDEIREFATRVEEVASAADTRFPRRDAAGRGDDETRDSEAADQTDAGVTADTRQNAPG
jgi:DivIVA domain-containing protein